MSSIKLRYLKIKILRTIKINRVIDCVKYLRNNLKTRK